MTTGPQTSQTLPKAKRPPSFYKYVLPCIISLVAFMLCFVLLSPERLESRTYEQITDHMDHAVVVASAHCEKSSQEESDEEILALLPQSTLVSYSVISSAGVKSQADLWQAPLRGTLPEEPVVSTASRGGSLSAVVCRLTGDRYVVAAMDLSSLAVQGFAWSPGLWNRDSLTLDQLAVWQLMLCLLALCSVVFLVGILLYSLLHSQIRSAALASGIWLALVTLMRIGAPEVWSLAGWSDLAHHSLVTKVLHSSLDLACIFLLAYALPRSIVRYRRYSVLFSTVAFALVLTLAIFYGRWTQSTLAYYNPLLENRGLFTMSGVDLSYYFGILTTGLLCFVTSFRCIEFGIRWSTSARRQWRNWAIASLLGLLLYVCTDLHLSYIPILALCTVFALLVDIFVDHLRVTFAWILSWTIFISMYVTLLVYHAHHLRAQDDQVNLSRQLLTEYQVKDEITYAYDRLVDAYDLGSISYAIYEDGNLVWQENAAMPDSERDLLENGDFDTVEALGNLRLYTDDRYRSVHLVSLFSYHFGLLSIIILIMGLLRGSVGRVEKIFPLRFRENSGLGDRIQFAIIASILFSFLTIAMLTLLFFSNHFQRSEARLLSQKTDLIQDRVRSLSPDGLWSLSVDQRQLLALYDSDGMLDPATPRSLRESSIVPQQLSLARMSEDIADPMDFRVYPIGRDSAREGYVLLPLQASSTENKQVINRFVSTLLNVYLFLFLIASAVAIYLSESITRPLEALRQRLKNFRLGKKNEALDYQGNDEISELIQNYNELIIQTENSANIMAMTERDMAWREMARQVAHEIKNPLTPMKLRVQHLLHSLQSRPDDALEMVERVSATIIEQIDNLSHIASEFSNFGKLPSATNEKIIINDVVSSVHDLFRKRDDLQVHLYTPLDEMYVFADRYHLIRVLTNLIKNGIQAIPQERTGRVEIRLYKQEENAIISVKDNGVGIPPEMQEKVFYPNFTTKNSGTGLGLAICSNLVELCQGKLYFETVVGKGTEFFVEIPLMRLRDNYELQERVEL